MSLKALPGKLGLPFFGEGPALLKNPFAFMDERFAQHGNAFQTRVFGHLVACLRGPEGLAFMYNEEFVTREKSSPPHIKEIMHPQAIPFLGGEPFATRRELLLQAFTKEALAGYADIVEQVITRYCVRWAGQGEVGGQSELGTMCFSIADALFAGADPDQDNPEMEAHAATSAAGLFAMPIPLFFTAYGKALKSRDAFRAYVATAVARKAEANENSVLARLVRAEAKDGSRLSEEELRIEVLHFYAAALAGIQGACINALRALRDYPQEAEQVLQEVKEVCESGSVASAALPQTDRFTKEVRRFYEMVPMTFFGTVQKDGEVEGYRIPKGHQVVGSLTATMSDAGSFSEPRTFSSKHLDTDEDLQYRYVAHGGGSMSGHRCVGEALADQVLRIFTARIVRDYDVTIPPQNESSVYGGLVPLPKDGLRMSVRAK